MLTAFDALLILALASYLHKTKKAVTTTAKRILPTCDRNAQLVVYMVLRATYPRILIQATLEDLK